MTADNIVEPDLLVIDLEAAALIVILAVLTASHNGIALRYTLRSILLSSWR